jgi:hypothetical protein
MVVTGDVDPAIWVLLLMFLKKTAASIIRTEVHMKKLKISLVKQLTDVAHRPNLPNLGSCILILVLLYIISLKKNSIWTY